MFSSKHHNACILSQCISNIILILMTRRRSLNFLVLNLPFNSHLLKASKHQNLCISHIVTLGKKRSALF